MGKNALCKLEINTEDIIKGICIGAGVGIIVAGIGNLIKAKKYRDEQKTEMMLGEDDFMDEVQRLEKNSIRNYIKGGVRIFCGVAVVLAGAFSFTDKGKKLIEDGKSYALTVKEEQIPVLVDKVRETAALAKERNNARKEAIKEKIKNEIVDEVVKSKVEEAVKSIDVTEKAKEIIAKFAA